MLWLLDDHTLWSICGHLGLRQKLYDLRHFTASQRILECSVLAFLSTFNRLAKSSQGNFSIPLVWGYGALGVMIDLFDSFPMGHISPIDKYGLSLTAFELFSWPQKCFRTGYDDNYCTIFI